MKFRLDAKDRLRLRVASVMASSCHVRARAGILLLLADGWHLAPLAIAAGVSRPTVYLWVRVFLAERTAESLDRRGITRRHRRAVRLARRNIASPGQLDVPDENDVEKSKSEETPGVDSRGHR